jgi:hypothetical protein
MASAIGAVDAQAGWTFSWPSLARTGHADGIEYRPNLRSVAALTGGDHD